MSSKLRHDSLMRPSLKAVSGSSALELSSLQNVYAAKRTVAGERTVTNCGRRTVKARRYEPRASSSTHPASLNRSASSRVSTPTRGGSSRLSSSSPAALTRPPAWLSRRPAGNASSAKAVVTNTKCENRSIVTFVTIAAHGIKEHAVEVL